MPRPKLTKEIRGGEPYEYFPLGKHIVAAPGVCGGRPTLKYTRIEVRFILEQLAAGETIDELVADYEGRISKAAILEAFAVAGQAIEREAVRELRARPRSLPRRVKVS